MEVSENQVALNCIPDWHKAHRQECGSLETSEADSDTGTVFDMGNYWIKKEGVESECPRS